MKDIEQTQQQTQHIPASHTYSCALKIEEAARATFSFPGYFYSFRTPRGDEYLGGGRDFSNPARVALLEARYLWPHSLELHPDILVSIGSGYSGDVPASESSNTVDELRGCKNSEAFWSKTFGEKSQQNPDRYIRLCPKFAGSFPDIDNVEALESKSLEQVTTEFLGHGQPRTETHNNIGGKVDLLVRRLISTIFYFLLTSPISHDSGEYVISGM